MQRLFSTFANGWPGLGLLLQRLVTAAAICYLAVAHLNQATPLASTILQMVAAGMGILLLVGLWTPVIGTLVAILEVCIAFVASDFLISILLATLSATLAMIGPGAWSIDAMLFGRRRIGTSER